MENADELLAGLRQMQISNPDAFKQAMESLGLSTGANGSNILDEADSLTKMADAIKQMRTTDSSVIGGDDLVMSKEKAKQPKGITITPTAGFAYKTTRISDGMKVFINMAQHEAVDEPAIKKKLDDNGEEVEGMNIPMSVGAPRTSEDKKGVPCIVYDIIVNPIVVSEASQDKTGKYRDFICQLGMQYLEQKYKEELDKRYKLPKLKYMGDEIATQYIQDRKSMPKIQEVSSKANPSATKKTAKFAEKVVAEVPDRDLPFSCAWLNSKQQSSTGQSSADSVHMLPGTTDINMEAYATEPYTHPTVEYLDPIFVPNPTSVAIVVTADIPSYELSLPDVKIQISPYKVALKLPGYKKVVLYLACAIKPSGSYYTLRRPYVGCISAVQVQLVLLVDHADWAETADAGSKTWLLTQALSDNADGDGGEGNPYGDSSRNTFRPAASTAEAAGDTDKEVLAEERFHISLPEGVDQYTGVKLEADDSAALDRLQNPTSAPPSKPASAGKAVVAKSPGQVAAQRDALEEAELPEDRFHKKDASSAYLINQRDQAKKDKWDKHEKEKAERANDPNVEYVDMDDFRPGGKYGPKESAASNLVGTQHAAQTEELRKAAEVIATAVGAGTEGGAGLNLSSNLWTELLD